MFMRKSLTFFLKKMHRGSTLIELLIATAIVGVIVTAVAAGVTNSVKNNAESRYREVAIALAQQGIEALRSERANLGWITFHNALSAGTFCMPPGIDRLADLSTTPADCIVTESNIDFNRSVVLTKGTGADEHITAVVTVSWERANDSDSSVSFTHILRNTTSN